jgi:DNA-binding PadR family transcriptional regulator
VSVQLSQPLSAARHVTFNALGMTTKELTAAELLVLGLVAEMPRHGYQLEQLIEQRTMREWTQIGFSSIYFVLGKLEAMKLVSAQRPAETKANSRARKTYSVTKAGRRTLVAQTLAALGTVRPTYASVLLGMINWPVLERADALHALQARRDAIEAERERLRSIRIDQQPLPDFIEALFDHSIGQLKAEVAWVTRTLDYMSSQPWLEGEDDDEDRRSEGAIEGTLSADNERLRLR